VCRTEAVLEQSITKSGDPLLYVQTGCRSTFRWRLSLYQRDRWRIVLTWGATASCGRAERARDVPTTEGTFDDPAHDWAGVPIPFRREGL